MKNFISFGCLVLVCVLLGLQLMGCQENKLNERNSVSKQPNFIIINIDDMGYGDIEPYGSTLNRTPNLNRMANEGAKFTSFYAAPVCSPSRASLMTGSYPKRAFPLPQNVLYPGDSFGLSPNEITIAELLKEQGYATGIIGKWHLGHQPQFLPTRQGFDYYFGIPYSNGSGPIEDGARNDLGDPPGDNPRSGHLWEEGYPPIPFIRNEKFVKRVLASDQQETVARYTEESIDFIEQNQDKPFFLYLPHTAVHSPLYPGEEFVGTSSNGLFGDWVAEVDWSVGRILEKTGELNLDEKTLILFMSDNGPTSNGSTGPLRGRKSTTWEGGVRVPFIARWPGKIPAGIEVDAISGMIDILPTITELAGGEIPDDREIDGKNIWPLLSGDPDAKPPHETFYFYRTLRLEAVRHGKWKLHLENGELYNLEEDIGESQNVAADHEDIVQEIYKLAEEMDRDLGKGGASRFKGTGPGVRPLGYVPDAKLIIDKNGNVREDFKQN